MARILPLFIFATSIALASPYAHAEPPLAPSPPTEKADVPQTITSPLGRQMTLKFNDEFDGTTEDDQKYIDRSKWQTTFWQGTTERTLSGNEEAQIYTDKDYSGRGNLPRAQRYNPFSFETPGILTVSAVNVPEELWAKWGMTKQRHYASGLLISDERFMFKYGYVEGRFKLPAARGAWPAFWLLPNDPKFAAIAPHHHPWPPEVDIFEYFGHRPTKFSFARHPRKADGEAPGFINYYSPGVDLSQDFHTWGFEWNEQKMAFTFDGKVIYTVDDVPDSFKTRMYMLINLGVGGTWYSNEMKTAGTPYKAWEVDDASMPWKMQVDWVRVYQE